MFGLVVFVSFFHLTIRFGLRFLFCIQNKPQNLHRRYTTIFFEVEFFFLVIFLELALYGED